MYVDDGYGEITDESFAQVEAEMEEMYGGYEPTDEELEGMFIQHVKDTVKSGKFCSELKDWLQVHDQIASLGRIRNGQPSEAVRRGAEADFRETMDLLGYDDRSRLTPAEWVDTQGRAAAKREGFVWESAVNGDYSIRPDFGMVDDVYFDDLPFDEMVAYRVAFGEPWTKEDTDILNNSIRKEWDSLHKHIAWLEADNEADFQAIDSIEQLRSQDGIQGNEEGLSWYEQTRRRFGESREAMEAEYEENKKFIPQKYKVLRDDLFKRVYATSMTRMDMLPEKTRGDFSSKDSLITKETYDYLGSEYGSFYRQQIRDYAKETVDSIKARSSLGVDFSLHGTGYQIAVEPQNDRTRSFVESQRAGANKSRELPKDGERILNSVENGVSNPDYDFDEYDN